MATVKSTGLTAAQTKTLQGIVNSNPTYAQSYSTGNAVSAPQSGGVSQTASNPHDAPGYNPATDPTSSVYKANLANPQTPAVPTDPLTTPATPQTAPNNAQVAPPNATPDLASAIAGKGSALTSAEMANPQTLNDLASRYKQGLANAKAANPQTPTTLGQASSAITSNLPQDGYDTNYVNQSLEQEPIYAKLLDSFAEMMSPPKQTESLVQQYDALRKSSGIDAINTELINTKRIIDGTEDDIRSEVVAANGFATDSQVLALASARNKTLIKNYNVLLDTRNSLNEQINTSIQLAGQDRAYAQQRMNQQLDIGFKILEYRDKFQNNAKENYNNIVKAVGYQGLLQSTGGDSYKTSLIENTLGLGQGGLAKLASTPKPGDNQIVQLDNGQTVVVDKNTGNIVKNLGGQKPMDTIGGIDEKTMGKIQASPEYKAINAVLPAIQALKSYQDAINTYGTTEQFSGEGKGTLKGTYGNALATWKTLAGLGALSGADFTLAENAVPETGFFKRSSTSKAKLQSSIDNAITQAENLTNRLSQNYPTAAQNLQLQLDDMKVSAYPDRFQKGPDGLVYEITN